MSRFTVVIADDRYASYDEEEAVLREVDAEVQGILLLLASEGARRPLHPRTPSS